MVKSCLRHKADFRRPIRKKRGKFFRRSDHERVLPGMAPDADHLRVFRASRDHDPVSFRRIFLRNPVNFQHKRTGGIHDPESAQAESVFQFLRDSVGTDQDSAALGKSLDLLLSD